jgi:membrane peptidoglycan carboxypeptidase
VIAALLGSLGFSLLAGLLVAVLVTPAIAVAGSAVNNSIGIFDSLPSFIEITQQPEANRIFATQNGQPVQIATIFSQNREEVAWNQVSQFAKDAAVSGEDKRFYQHGGVDLAGIARAAVKNIVGGSISEGASTITQQYVKNTFIQAALELPTAAQQEAAYQAAVSTTFDRKLKEMKLAIALEKKYTKQQILVAYLNIANFGGTTYGIEAAAQRYYKTTAANLTVSQAASLIAIVQAPTDLGLQNSANYARNQARRDVIVQAMYADKQITAAQRDEALKTPINGTTVTLTTPNNGCMVANQYAQYWCSYITNLVKDLPALGSNATERAASFKHGGYDFYTTLDLGLQTIAQQTEWQYASNTETRFQLGSATTSVQVGTGRILTMAQNKTFNDTQAGGGSSATAVNFSTDEAYGGSSGFQPGSTYKLFTLLNWLQAGHGINEVVNGSARTVRQQAFTDSCHGPWTGTPYQFSNDEASERGNMTVASATQRSVNGAFISMALDLDLCSIKNTAMSLGVHRADGTTLQSNPSSVLGTNEIAPLTMNAAYAAIANGGIYCAPIAIDKIVGPDGKTLAGQAQNCTNQLDPDVANTAAYAMSKVITAGTGAASNPNDPGVEWIGKTGTTDSSNQTWVIASNTKVASAVWVGNIVGQKALRSISVNGINASLLRHSIMKTIAKAIDAVPAYRGAQFPAPAGPLLNGSGKGVPSVTGQSADSATSLLQATGFTVITGSSEDSSLPVGQVTRTDPPTGTIASKGSVITLYTSNGAIAAMPNVVGDGTVSPDSARSQLANAGFTSIQPDGCTVLTADQTSRVGKVVATNPAPGAQVKKSDNVTIDVGKLKC